MVRNMGIVRERAGLVEAERQVAFWCRYVLRREFSTRAGWELQNLLTVARLMIWSALQRTESRGVHYRATSRSATTSIGCGTWCVRRNFRIRRVSPPSRPPVQLLPYRFTSRPIRKAPRRRGGGQDP